MRTSKKEQISDELKPFVSNLIKTSREKYNYSLEDLSKAINNKKNRQTLHKYEKGLLNIPYDILFDICRVFNIDSEIFKSANISEEETKIIEKKLIKDYGSTLVNHYKIKSIKNSTFRVRQVVLRRVLFVCL